MVCRSFEFGPLYHFAVVFCKERSGTWNEIQCKSIFKQYLPWHKLIINPSKWQILDSSKLTEFADDNFEFNENGAKISKRVENTVGKGEIARYEQFLLFPWCFQKTNTADT